MRNREIGILQRLAAASLEKCLLRISGASAGKWKLAGVNISGGTLAAAVGLRGFKGHDAAAVYIHVKSGLPFTALMFIDADDIGHISVSYLDESLAGAVGLAQFEEVMLLELGNIMLNAIINYLQNALKKSAIPSVPMLLKGRPAAIVKGLGAYIDPAESFTIVSAAFTVARGGRVSRGEVLLVLPAGLAAELEPG